MLVFKIQYVFYMNSISQMSRISWAQWPPGDSSSCTGQGSCRESLTLDQCYALFFFNLYFSLIKVSCLSSLSFKLSKKKISIMTSKKYSLESIVLRFSPSPKTWPHCAWLTYVQGMYSTFCFTLVFSCLLTIPS